MSAKNLKLKILICLAGVAMTPAAGAETLMTGFTLRSCSNDGQTCIEVTAERTVGSKLKMLHRFSNPKVNMFRTKASQEINIYADSGYIDVAENQLVLFSKNEKFFTETSIDLTTMEIFSQTTEAK